MMRRPSIRNRLTVIAAAAVTIVAVAVGLLAWLALRQTLIQQVDRELQGFSRGPIHELSATEAATIRPTPLDAQKDMRMQVRFGDGTTVSVPRDTSPMPWSEADNAVSQGIQARAGYTAGTADGRFRVLTFRGGQGQTIQLARSLSNADATLQRFGVLIAVLIAGATTIAALAGRLVARAGLRPVDRLTGAATSIAETRDLSRPIKVDGHDEIAQLGQAFNHMLARLDAAQQQQRDLIEDAAHELRTPMSSLRTNIDLLVHADGRLDSTDQAALLADLQTQTAELSELVANLVDLARSQTTTGPATPVELTELAAEAVSLAQAHFPRAVFALRAPRPVTVTGHPAALERAIVNLLDNAAKFGPAGRPIDIHISASDAAGAPVAQVSVLDRCPTIPDDQREKIFRRFHRTDDARSVPGSGLGLAIVQQTVTAHGGTVTASARPGGGNTFTLTLPLTQDPPRT